MVQQYLAELYDSTISYLDKKLDKGTFEYAEKYKDYLKDKYSLLLNDFLKDEDVNRMTEIIQILAKQELRLWGDFNESQLFALLEKDTAFKELEVLSYTAFALAKNRMKSKICISEQKYTQMHARITQYFSEVKHFNLDAARELRSEAILDLEYAFKETEIISLRLAKLR